MRTPHLASLQPGRRLSLLRRRHRRSRLTQLMVTRSQLLGKAVVCELELPVCHHQLPVHSVGLRGGTTHAARDTTQAS